jgi:hypothetical protein
MSRHDEWPPSLFAVLMMLAVTGAVLTVVAIKRAVWG